jgi:hypothetical protein
LRDEGPCGGGGGCEGGVPAPEEVEGPKSRAGFVISPPLSLSVLGEGGSFNVDLDVRCLSPRPMGPEAPPWVGDEGSVVGDGDRADGIVTDCAKGLLGDFNAPEAAAPGRNPPPVTVFRGKESGEGRRGEVLAVGLPLGVRESDVEGVVAPREGEDVDGLMPPFMNASSRPKLQNKLSS